MAEVILELAADAILFSDAQSNAYARVSCNEHDEIWPLRSRAFREWLGHRFYQLSGKGVNRNVMADVLDTLVAKARFEGGRHEVFGRIAGNDKAVLIDLGDCNWQAVEVTAKRWRITRADTVFVRRPNALPLPLPQRGGKLDEMRPFLNVSDEGFTLICAWLIAALHGQGALPILILQGEQGTGKSTVTKIIRSLVDPSAVPLRPLPREERDLLIGALNSYVLALDNLSGLQPWQSDALCRISTGGGYANRTLYSDTEETAADIRRPLILNGIDDLAARADLADRALVVTLAPITKGARDEMEMMRAWERVRPRVFGALLQCLSKGLRDLHKVQRRLPRMARFARLSTAALGESFMAAYQRNRASLVTESLEASPLAVALLKLLEKSNPLVESPTKLLERLSVLSGNDERPPPGWPRTARGLKNALNRLAPHLRAQGVTIEQGGGGREGRNYTITLAGVGAKKSPRGGTLGTDRAPPLHAQRY